MSIYFSKTSGGFYDDRIHKTIPADAVQITSEKHQFLLNGQGNGKEIGSDEKGNPILIDAPQPDPQVIKNQQARNLLRETDWYVVRFAETGTPIPDDIRAARESARASVVE